jgi:hypothetical protein
LPDLQNSNQGLFPRPGVFHDWPIQAAYCFECGTALPWTTEKLAAARDLADELDSVSADDRAILETAIEDIATGGLRVEAARTKRLVGKASTAAGQAICKNQHRGGERGSPKDTDWQLTG